MINEFDHMLTLNRTTILKFFLYISKDEQKHRLQSRLDDRGKHWKFSSADILERAYWDQYMQAIASTTRRSALCPQRQTRQYQFSARSRGWSSLLLCVPKTSSRLRARANRVS
jgi:hypothetical protein